ncbi:hypothetical protein B5M09_000818 [Aphanomyces astaci]|uniref:non-specific serine/threonine protein kinase n=1 Tax=Aphanomyces astaci TaxID=112090 RepID=A0A425D9J8_APHAT|nr:hypothetical protein B5M09_000818 [Aphanomyces astaci]
MSCGDCIHTNFSHKQTRCWWLVVLLQSDWLNFSADSCARKIDDEVVAKCLTLDFPGGTITRDHVIHSIEHEEYTPLRVAYDLVLDHKNAKMRIDELRNVKRHDNTPKTFSQPDQSSLLVPGRGPIPMAASPMIQASPGDPLMQRQFGGRTPLARGPPAANSSHGGGVMSVQHQMNEAALAEKKRRRWYLGIQSKKEPAHVMSEVYKALLVLHFEWKVLAPYRVKCRWQPAPPPPSCSTSVHKPVKIGLQLYKVQQHIYLLDFQNLGGDAFTYMNLCARIITELKTLSGVRPTAAAPSHGDMLHGYNPSSQGGGLHQHHHPVRFHINLHG